MTESRLPARPTFVAHTEIELTLVTGDRVEGHIEVAALHHQPYGVVHGGVYSTLVETLASEGAAAWAIENGRGGAMGISNTTDFLKAVTDGHLAGVATPIHRGRTQQLWEVDVRHQESGRLVAHGQVRLQNVDKINF